MKSIKALIKKVPFAVNILELVRPNSTTLNVLDTFPLYLPNSAGKYKNRAKLTIQTINHIFPFLSDFSQQVGGTLLDVENVMSVPVTDKERASVVALKERLDFYGSDKANVHNYHFLYGPILANKESVRNIFEIGLGTNKLDVVSTMGEAGKPGASLRAFRDYCPNASIFGADIDTRILFVDDRITTLFIDQTNPATFAHTLAALPERSMDLVIDDGLHSPDANIASLALGLAVVKPEGWVVIEDISDEAIAFWQVVAALLPSNCRAKLYEAEGGVLFAVRKVS